MNLADIPHIAPHPYDKPLEPGEYYAAQRNGPAIIGVCLKHCVDDYFVIADRDDFIKSIYPYNVHECRRITKETYDELHEKANTEHVEWLRAFWGKK